MNDLERRLVAIQNEKTTKLLPENIKKDVTILGVTGILDETLTQEEYNYALSLTSNILAGDSPIPFTSPYKLLDYIESTGTQYIDTNYYANGNTRYEFLYSDNKTNGVLFGAYNEGGWEEGSGLYTNIANPRTTDKILWYHYYSNTAITGYYEAANEWINLNKGNVYMNNVLCKSMSQKEFNLDVPTYIFTGNWSGEIVEPTSYKLHYFKIYDNNELVRNYLPALRVSDNEAGLYDLVEGKFYRNQGTGKFITGGVVNG